MQANDVKQVVVVGAGVMGHSIAQVFATAGIQTNLVDLNWKVLDHAKRLIDINLETLAEHGRIKKESIPTIKQRINFTDNLSEASQNADFVVEAVSEVPEVKQKVFSVLEAHTPPHALLASNTSGLEIFNIIEFKDPTRVLITHWFSPPHIIPLVEVAPGPKTAPDAIKTVVSLVERVGKRPVVMREFVPSFIVNRIQSYIFLAVMEMLDKKWATPEDIDYAVKMSLGVRLPIVGVVQSFDFTGLDLLADMIKNRGLNYPIIENKVKEGKLGAKTGGGLFDYQGRKEEEILKKRDALYLSMCDYLEKLNNFKPV